MKHLVIIGARGAGRETYSTALNTRECEEGLLDVKGFLDDKSDALDSTPGYPPILSSVEDYEIQEDDVFICALGNPVWRKKYVEKILSKGGHFVNIIDKTATIGPNVKMGTGCIIKRYVGLSCDVSVGDYVFIQAYTAVGHDAKIGNYCHLNTNSFMGGYAELADGVVMQTHAILLPHKKAGEWSTIGAGSVAIRNVKAGTTVMGVPAKLITF